MDRNQKIYKIYRVFGYDYLFYTVINFLFFTITKGISVGQVMYLSAFSAIFICILEIPLNYVVEKIGLRKSMIIGNLFWIISLFIVIISNSFIAFVFAEFCCSIGTTLKSLSETQYLYASLKQTGNRKDFAKIEGAGVSGYYYFEAISALFVGSMFEINNYMPVVLTMAFLIISFITSMFFEEIQQDYKPEKNSLKTYLKDFKYILKSKRIISLFIYSFLMSGIIAAAITLQKSTIINLNVSSVTYSLIFSVFTFCIGFGSKLQYITEKITKRKTLTLVGYLLTGLLLLLGIINIFISDNNIVLLLSILILFIHNVFQGVYRISIKKYMNNFTTSKVRGKILSIFYIFENIGKAALLFISGIIIDNNGTNITSIIVGIFGIMSIYFVLKYMKTRLGLDPEEYEKDDVFGAVITKE